MVAATDGVWSAGVRDHQQLDVSALAARFHRECPGDARALADAVLTEALALDHGRPHDDISVLVVCVTEGGPADGARRLEVSFPLPPF